MKKIIISCFLLTITTFGSAEVWRPFSDDSPWNQPIKSTDKVAPNSDEQIAYINEHFKEKSLLPFGECRLKASIAEWSIPVYYIDSTSDSIKKIEVPAHNSWGKDLKAPIPPYAKPTAAEDASLAIVDKKAKKSWEFYEIRGEYPNYTSGYGRETDLAGKGVITGGSSRESGVPLVAGLILPEEIKAGKIEHALVFSFDARDGYDEFIFPATQGTDNDSTNASKAMPMGTRLQLKPDVDISNFPKGTQVVLEALKKYGMYLVDENDSKTMNIYFQSNGNWDGIFDSDDIEALNRIKASDFRVINYVEDKNKTEE
ncbi:MAG: hypothetical protein DSY38_00730 [Fusobacteria bacterium]|nr:MAG: hypothetical protein DSY38_00730 [Fusobacteriota bacterium]